MPGCRWVAALLLLLPAERAHPQHPQRPLQIRGQVFDSVAMQPLAGAVVIAMSSAGGQLARTLTDVRGRYLLAEMSQVATLRVLRIGYQPRTVAIRANGDTLLRADVYMMPLGARLATVDVSGSALCGNRRESREAFALWSQAQAALLASVVARETRPPRASTLRFTRTIRQSDSVIVRESVRVNAGTMERPFVAAASASEFATSGFMRADSSGRTFFAPDADVLLDTAFAATHCFDVVKDTRAGDRVGLRFEPGRHADGRVEVAGTLWFDGSLQHLVRLDFRFVDVPSLGPATSAAEAGGYLAFAYAGDGVAFVDDWLLRMPVLATSPAPEPEVFRTVRTDEPQRDAAGVAHVEAVVEDGGMVLNAAWRDSTTWAPPMLSSTVRIVNRARQAVPRAVLAFSATRDTLAADTAGVVQIPAYLLPGRYAVDLIDTTDGAFIEPRVAHATIDIVRGSAAHVEVDLPSVAAVVARLCPDASDTTTSTVIGRVVIGGAESLRDLTPLGLTVRAQWQATYNNGSPIEFGTEATAAAINIRRHMSHLDAGGRFQVCGVARERPVRLELLRGANVVRDTSMVVYDSLARRVVWTVPYRAVIPPA